MLTNISCDSTIWETFTGNIIWQTFSHKYNVDSTQLVWSDLIYLPTLPNVVGSKPSVPRTSGWTVSPRYTGKASEQIPTQNPDKTRPAMMVNTFGAQEISRNAEIKTRIKLKKLLK